MIQDLKYFLSSLIEPPNFPFWELYVFFIMLLFISIIIRLDRLEKKMDNAEEKHSDLLDHLYEEGDQ